MELKPENVDHSSSSYLYLQIDVDHKQFDFKLFDKNVMPFPSLLFVCLIYKVTCLLRCFILQSVQRVKFVELLSNIPIFF